MVKYILLIMFSLALVGCEFVGRKPYIYVEDINNSGMSLCKHIVPPIFEDIPKTPRFVDKDIEIQISTYIKSLKTIIQKDRERVIRDFEYMQSECIKADSFNQKSK